MKKTKKLGKVKKTKKLVKIEEIQKEPPKPQLQYFNPLKLSLAKQAAKKLIPPDDPREILKEYLKLQGYVEWNGYRVTVENMDKVEF